MKQTRTRELSSDSVKQDAKSDFLWITWEVQIRNRSLSKLIDVPLIEVTTSMSGIRRYLVLIIRTVSIIREKKPKVLIVQNPSIVLAILGCICKAITGQKLIVDAHNAGIYPKEGSSKVLNFLSKNICRNSDYTVVSNKNLLHQVSLWGGKAIAVSDPIPALRSEPNNNRHVSENFILFICTWSQDEPYREVIKAARKVKFDIVITGKYQKVLSHTELKELPNNVKLVGFVSEDDYIDLLHQSAATLDLTTRENCLVCGAYESIAVEKPCIISDTEVNRETFQHGFVYSKNDSDSIATAIEFAINNLSTLKGSIISSHNEHQEKAKQNKGKLEEILAELRQEH